MSGKREWTLGDWLRKPGVRMPDKTCRQVVARVEGEFDPPVVVVPKSELVAAEEALQEALDVIRNLLLEPELSLVAKPRLRVNAADFVARHGRLPVQSEQEGAAAPNQPKGQHP